MISVIQGTVFIVSTLVMAYAMIAFEWWSDWFYIALLVFLIILAILSMFDTRRKIVVMRTRKHDHEG